MSTNTPKYAEMMKAIDEAHAWAIEAIDKMDMEDLPALVKIATNYKPEMQATKIREKAERNMGKLIKAKYRQT